MAQTIMPGWAYQAIPIATPIVATIVIPEQIVSKHFTSASGMSGCTVRLANRKNAKACSMHFN